MDVPIRLLVPFGLAALLAGCTPVQKLDGRRPTGRPAPPGATVLEEELFHHGVGTLLGTLRVHIRGMQVHGSATGCPRITMRGTRSLTGDNNPLVYVDGARATNTCILEQLAPVGIRKVEVYPAGITPRPPYHGHPNGLILVFTDSGSP